MPAKVTSYARKTVVERLFGLSTRNLNQRAVRFKMIDGHKEYDLESLVENCADLMVKNLQNAAGAKADAEAQEGSNLREQELEEKVRKLKLANDEREGQLVSVDEMRRAYGRKVREVADILDSIPTQVKMGAPDISQAALEVVQSSVSKIRNQVADHELGE